MTRHIALALLTMALTAASFTPALGMNLEEGFLGQEWGKNLTADKSFTKLRTAGIVDYFSNDQIKYNFSDIESAYVVFGAILGELYAVFVGIDSDKGYTRMKDYLSSKFGMPKVKDQVDAQEHTWSIYDHKVRIKLKNDLESGEKKLAIYYMPLVRPDTPAFNRSIDEFPSYKFDDGDMRPDAIPLLAF